MGDTTYFQIDVIACPPEQTAAFAYALQQAFGAGFFGFGDFLVEEAPPGSTRAVLVPPSTPDGADTWWAPTNPEPAHEWDLYAEDVSVATVEDTDWQPVIAAAPDAVWRAWTDPKYEWLGSLVCYSRRSGLVAGPCDADGNLTVPTARIIEQLEALPNADGLIDRDAALRAVAPDREWFAAAAADAAAASR